MINNCIHHRGFAMSTMKKLIEAAAQLFEDETLDTLGTLGKTVRLGDYVDNMKTLYDNGIFVGPINLQGTISVDFKSAETGQLFREQCLELFGAVTPIKSIGQGMVGFKIDVSDLTISEVANKFDELISLYPTTPLEA